MDNLIKLIKKFNNPSVVGLDTTLTYIPNHIKKEAILKYNNTPKAAAYAITTFNKKIIDEIKYVVPAVKFQMACYEALGYNGIYSLQQSCEYAKNSGMYVILDGKRNDISSSMKYYSNAYLGQTELLNGKRYSAFNCDCLTINGYLGSDSLKIVLEDCIKYSKEVFVLLKTSNPSSAEIQDEKTSNSIPIYEKMGEICETLSKEYIGQYGYSKIGAVVGATYPEQLQYLRERFKNTFFLVPGYGAQGATAKNVKFAFKDGIGAIINSSRNIIAAWQKDLVNEYEFAKYSKIKAEEMKADILANI